MVISGNRERIYGKRGGEEGKFYDDKISVRRYQRSD